MKISELVLKLQALQIEHGDMEVTMNTKSPVDVTDVVFDKFLSAVSLNSNTFHDDDTFENPPSEGGEVGGGDY